MLPARLAADEEPGLRHSPTFSETIRPEVLGRLAAALDA